MGNLINVNDYNLKIKEWNGKRVVTLSDIDKVHGRPEGTAKTRFFRRKNRFNQNGDYFIIKPSDAQKYTKDTLGINKIPNRGITLITESGYLLLVKTFDDDLAWTVQRQLVNTYFKTQELVESIHPDSTSLIVREQELFQVVDTLSTCAAVFQNMMEYTTINYKQQQELLLSVRKRINHLLGGARSEVYKDYSRIYFKNLWLNFCTNFNCSTYKDLNPLYMDLAREFIQEWKYK